MRDVVNVRMLLRNLGLFALMVLLMRFSRGAGFAVFVLLSFSAVLQNKADRVIVYMMIAVCALIGNGILMPKSTLFNLEHKAMMLVMALLLVTKIAGRAHSRLVTPMLGMFAYVAVMVVSSAQGWSPIISYLKLFLFVMTFYAYYAFGCLMIKAERMPFPIVRSAYLAMACFMVFGSILLLPFPGISQLSGEAYLEAEKAGVQLTSLFCGMTFHSQALGPIVASVFALVFADLLFCVGKPNKLMIALLACCPILIYKTSSRTAMGTMLAGGMFVLYHFMKMRRVNARWKGKVTSAALMVAIVCSILLIVSGSGRKSVAKYMLKGRDDVKLGDIKIENVTLSRQGLMDEAVSNFKESPFLGNGFQVSKQYIGVGKGNFQLKDILSAPVEKGVWVTAILEEGGVLGFAVFVLFAVIALVTLTQRRAYCCASVFFVILVSNLGEFTMFSMSGAGGFYWCLCFFGAVLDAQHHRHLSRAANPALGMPPKPYRPPAWRAQPPYRPHYR